MREVKVLKMVKHPNIVQLKQAFRKKGIVYLVFEYVQNNLLQVLQKSPDGIDQDLIRLYIYQLLKGLNYMHSQNIVHRDIKPENLLISDKKQLKICDFGFARQVKHKIGEEELTDYVATRWYRPPQLLVGAPYSKQIDIWAVGCILGQLVDGNPMFPGQNELDQLFLIQKCLGPLTTDHYQTFLKNPRFLGMKFPDIQNLQTIQKRYLGKLSPKGLHFLKQLLRMNANQRITAMDALKHPYFDGIRDEDFNRKLSSNNPIRNQSKINPIGDSKINHKINNNQMKFEQPRLINHQRKKMQTNEYHPVTYDRQRTQQSHGGQFNRSQKTNLTKRPKQDINKLLNSKGFNNNQIHSKSVNKTNKPNSKQLKQKNISLQKHQNRQILTKTQTGFYILTGNGIVQERQEQYSPTTQNSRNKIYNSKSPHTNHRSRGAPTNTEQILEQQETWQSNSQLPMIMVGSQQAGRQKTKGPTNIIITNSIFNYKSHH